MNPTPLLQKLIDVARREIPSERVPYAFEKRIMARLRPGSALDLWAAWNSVFWRALTPCCVVMLIIGALGVFSLANPGARITDEPLEAVLLADLDSGPDHP
jgi:hypothetical protein